VISFYFVRNMFFFGWIVFGVLGGGGLFLGWGGGGGGGGGVVVCGP